MSPRASSDQGQFTDEEEADGTLDPASGHDQFDAGDGGHETIVSREEGGLPDGTSIRFSDTVTDQYSDDDPGSDDESAGTMTEQDSFTDDVGGNDAPQFTQGGPLPGGSYTFTDNVLDDSFDVTDVGAEGAGDGTLPDDGGGDGLDGAGGQGGSGGASGPYGEHDTLTVHGDGHEVTSGSSSSTVVDDSGLRTTTADPDNGSDNTFHDVTEDKAASDGEDKFKQIQDDQGSSHATPTVDTYLSMVGSDGGTYTFATHNKQTPWGNFKDHSFSDTKWLNNSQTAETDDGWRENNGGYTIDARNRETGPGWIQGNTLDIEEQGSDRTVWHNGQVTLYRKDEYASVEAGSGMQNVPLPGFDGSIWRYTSSFGSAGESSLHELYVNGQRTEYTFETEGGSDSNTHIVRSNGSILDLTEETDNYRKVVLAAPGYDITTSSYDRRTWTKQSDDDPGESVTGTPLTTYHSNSPGDAPPDDEPAGGGVGQPAFLESLIPVWGSGRAAVDDFQNRRYGRALFNVGMVGLDIFGGFLIKGALKVGGKVIAKVAVGQAAKAPLLLAARPKLTQRALEHIVERHWATSGAKSAGKFSSNTTARDLRTMITRAAEKGKWKPERFNRSSIEFDFGRQIGVDMNGKATTKLRVILEEDLTVVTAFPVK